MESSIRLLNSLPPAFEMLSQANEREGFHFLKRLKQEFVSGVNCFDKEGEILCGVYQNEQLIALEGINTWLYQDNSVGRLRRFYVLPDYRKQGIGRLLLTHLENAASSHFETLYLYTDTVSAAQFYQACGYEACDEAEANFKKVFKKQPR
ncbi:GNAT family N-acetyltransferase [Thiolinea disciformis]|uniref:GNAT family N-acetyltransferase n=1 Tax=Thiolinea disciformis TaxID=125614 RepID=UPI00037F4E32|nr:GNAT family N-acetyltransferase [Thiolinea disciformis]